MFGKRFVDGTIEPGYEKTINDIIETNKILVNDGIPPIDITPKDYINVKFEKWI